MTTHRTRPDDGFTLMEMVVSLTIIALVFMAVAAVMGSGLKVLAVQKGRTQGNEVATQGIEDLQRYSYTNLALCTLPSDVATPTDIVGKAAVPGPTTCPAGSPAIKAAYGDQPCAAGTGTGVPRATYPCTRNNITYTVRRYVVWTNDEKIAKQLAVYVQWSDSVGTHTVSQQSSLRSPAMGDVVGVEGPAVIASSSPVSPYVERHDNVVSNAGVLQTAIAVAVKTSGLTDPLKDRVAVSFRTVASNGELTTTTMPLTPSPSAASWDKTTWVGSITPQKDGIDLVFPFGSQHLVFTVVRDSDGKTGSLIDTTTVNGLSVSRFCPTGVTPDPCASLPTFDPAVGPLPQSDQTFTIDPAGGLLENIEFAVVTDGLASTDSVAVQIRTRSGTFTSGMRVESCAATRCRWTASILPSSGVGFFAGTESAVFVASSEATRSTAAAVSVPLTFEVQGA